MSTESIIKVGGITSEEGRRRGPPISLIHKETIGGEDYIGGEDFIEGAGDGITRDIKGL